MNELYRAIVQYFQRVATYDLLVVCVELLLIGMFVGWVMRFLRGTRGARLFKGAALVLASVYVVISMLPEKLGWQRIQFLYGNFLLFAFGAVVVAFQPELRRAFIQIGQTRFFRANRRQIDDVVESLVDSAAYLSRNKIGAVMAIERTVGLGTIIDAGTPIDAVLTSSLLNTIFYPGSTLHDMGVIIREGRIAAAGCQFPLIESEEADPSLGSRHRAAMGLAKEGDAVVLVVSEETGRISLAYEGQLYIGLELDNLREMLATLLSPPKFLRRRESASQGAHS
ncbi:MAG: diadenylate cyclase CdaA [Phycisphaerae bacterium]|jgi:diadenylate cyclase